MTFNKFAFKRMAAYYFKQATKFYSAVSSHLMQSFYRIASIDLYKNIVKKKAGVKLPCPRLHITLSLLNVLRMCFFLTQKSALWFPSLLAPCWLPMPQFFWGKILSPFTQNSVLFALCSLAAVFHTQDGVAKIIRHHSHLMLLLLPSYSIVLIFACNYALKISRKGANPCFSVPVLNSNARL